MGPSSDESRRKAFGPAGLRRRAELMEAAVRLAARNGFSGTRVSDIVGRVGVGQGVFYWYFESKEALFREILADTTTRLRRFQGAFIRDEPDPVRRIAKGILASLDFIAHNRYAFALLDHAQIQSRLRAERSEAGRVHVLDVVRHVEEAMQRGGVRRTDSEVLAQGVAGVVDRLARSFLPSSPDPDLLTQEVIDFCLGGIVGARTITVAELRTEVPMTAELEALRDHVGMGVPEGELYVARATAREGG